MDFGEKSNVWDGPIYLKFSYSDQKDLYKCFWYVIEEKDADLILREKIEDEVEEILGKKKKDDISVLVQSETEIIKGVHFPDLNYSTDALVIFNSRFYVFGAYRYPEILNRDRYPEILGCDDDICEAPGEDGICSEAPAEDDICCEAPAEDDICCEALNRISVAPEDTFRTVFYLDTMDLEKGWLKGPELNASRSVATVGVLKKYGFFYAFGVVRHANDPFGEFLLDPLNGNWYPMPHQPRISICNARLLAVTDTKVYVHGLVIAGCGIGLCFDVENSKWYIFDHHFKGVWEPGVVLEFCGKSYLFLFGLQQSEEYIAYEKFCVYDLNECTWLPDDTLFPNLPRDDTVFPNPKTEGTTKYLLQMKQRNKLALVWSRTFYTLNPFVYLTDIHCTKFIIHCSFNSDTQHPIFRAKLVSLGYYRLKDGGWLSNCAAG